MAFLSDVAILTIPYLHRVSVLGLLGDMKDGIDCSLDRLGVGREKRAIIFLIDALKFRVGINR